MDWSAALADVGTIAAVATGIAFVVQFIKKIYYKIPWNWVQHTPGEIWYALSIIAGLGVAIFVSWDNIKIVLTGDTSFTSKTVEIIMGLAAGAGSKVLHAVASPAGAALSAFKLEKKAKADALSAGKGYIEKGTGVDALANVSTPLIVEQECATPVFPALEERIEKTKLRIDEAIIIPKKIDVPLVELLKKMKTDADYILLDGQAYEIKK
jgi:hypothetical protein